METNGSHFINVYTFEKAAMLHLYLCTVIFLQRFYFQEFEEQCANCQILSISVKLTVSKIMQYLVYILGYCFT